MSHLEAKLPVDDGLLAEPASENRADLNRSRRLLAVRELDRLLAEAIHPAFRGTVAVEISAKDGRLSEPKTTRIRFGTSD